MIFRRPSLPFRTSTRRLFLDRPAVEIIFFFLFWFSSSSSGGGGSSCRRRTKKIILIKKNDRQSRWIFISAIFGVDGSKRAAENKTKKILAIFFLRPADFRSMKRRPANHKSRRNRRAGGRGSGNRSRETMEPKQTLAKTIAARPFAKTRKRRERERERERERKSEI